MNNTVLSILVLVGMSGGLYAYHSNAVKDAVREERISRDTLWEKRISDAELLRKETNQKINNRYTTIGDDDLDDEFARVYPDAGKDHCECAGELRSDSIHESGQDSFPYSESGFTESPEEDPDLSEELTPNEVDAIRDLMDYE